MAQPARGPAAADEAPPVDREAVDRAYRFHRAKRRARLERRLESRWAGLRFLAAVVVLLFAIVFLALAVWDETRRLFGL